MSLNTVALVGRMVRDPELRTTTTGKNVVEFSLAVEKRFKPQNDGDPKADFLRCKVWGQGADYVAQYGGKGRLLAVNGRIETRAYNDKDGNKREVVEIVADNVSLLDRPPEGQGGSGTGTSGSSHAGYSARPAAQPAPRPAQQPRGNTPNPDEYDPFADE